MSIVPPTMLVVYLVFLVAELEVPVLSPIDLQLLGVRDKVHHFQDPSPHFCYFSSFCFCLD
jgi:hypothetical protein